jgi:hypothetical protein
MYHFLFLKLRIPDHSFVCLIEMGYFSYYIGENFPNMILKKNFRMSDKMKCFRFIMIRKKLYVYISKGIEG